MRNRIGQATYSRILFLTARVEDADKVQGFAAGGDDYVVKPFSLEELGARVAAHIRRERRHFAAADVRFDGDLAINYTGRTVTFRGSPIAFAPKEFDIIEFLSQNMGQVFTRERIYERVWGYDGRAPAAANFTRMRRTCSVTTCGSLSFSQPPTCSWMRSRSNA